MTRREDVERRDGVWSDERDAEFIDLGLRWDGPGVFGEGACVRSRTCQVVGKSIYSYTQRRSSAGRSSRRKSGGVGVAGVMFQDWVVLEGMGGGRGLGWALVE